MDTDNATDQQERYDTSDVETDNESDIEMEDKLPQMGRPSTIPYTLESILNYMQTEHGMDLFAFGFLSTVLFWLYFSIGIIDWDLKAQQPKNA